jgi:sigma-B regulation protein RsbU (phosphoserine phosphatase)
MKLTRRNAVYIQYLIEEILLVTERTLKASASSMFLLDQENKELCFQFVRGPVAGILKEAKLSTETGIVGWVARHSEPLLVNNVADDQRFCGDMDDITGFATKSILCAPLIAHNKTIGVIEVLNKLDGSDFNEYDLQTLVAVASTSAVAIELKLAEEAIHNSEEHYVKLVDNLSDRQAGLLDPDSFSKGKLTK